MEPTAYLASAREGFDAVGGGLDFGNDVTVDEVIGRGRDVPIVVDDRF